MERGEGWPFEGGEGGRGRAGEGDGQASPTIGSDVVGNYQSVLIAHWVAAPGTRSIPLSHRLTRPVRRRPHHCGRRARGGRA